MADPVAALTPPSRNWCPRSQHPWKRGSSLQFMFISIAFDLNSGTTHPHPAQSTQLPPAAERLPYMTDTSSSELTMLVGPHHFAGETDQVEVPPCVLFSSLCAVGGHSCQIPLSSYAHLLSHQTGGLWDVDQKYLHVNVLELVAIRLAVVKRPDFRHAILGWDLALVLHTLHAAPLEPLASRPPPPWALTFKTVFHVAVEPH